MKIFWSWQSDVPARTGRRVVRAALEGAIKKLKEPPNIEEPAEREAKSGLHVDSDRQGVPGSPDLATTILRKIEESAVFVADVTLVAESSIGLEKRAINSNVAIEYGYALHAIGDRSILMVQNTFYGKRDHLPFDLRHKAGPIVYELRPDASTEEIKAEEKRLTDVFVQHLRPYVGRLQRKDTALNFIETPATTNCAVFWNPSEVIATYESRMGCSMGHHNDKTEYRFGESPIFYLRLIPTTPLSQQLQRTKLNEIVERRCLPVLTRTNNGTHPSRNRYGAASYQSRGNSNIPVAFTQMFLNGEIWAVSSEPFLPHRNNMVVPVENIRNILWRVLPTFICVAQDEFLTEPPFQIEVGAVGLRGMCLTLPESGGYFPYQISGEIYENEIKIRNVVTDVMPETLRVFIEVFIHKLYDLASIVYQAPQNRAG